MDEEPTAISQTLNRTHDQPTHYCVIREVFVDGEWSVASDTVEVTSIGTETVGDTGFIYFFDPESDTNLVVSADRFITAYTNGVA